MKCAAFLFLMAIVAAVEVPPRSESGWIWLDFPFTEEDEDLFAKTMIMSYLGDVETIDTSELTIVEASVWFLEGGDYPKRETYIVAYYLNDDEETCVIRFKHVYHTHEQEELIPDTKPDCAKGDYEGRYEALKDQTESQQD